MKQKNYNKILKAMKQHNIDQVDVEIVTSVLWFSDDMKHIVPIFKETIEEEFDYVCQTIKSLFDKGADRDLTRIIRIVCYCAFVDICNYEFTCKEYKENQEEIMNRVKKGE